MRTSLILILFSVLFILSCGTERKKEATVRDSTASAQKDTLMLDNVPPGAEPVWDEGITFDENTMKATVAIRSAELHNLFLRTEKRYPGLHGNVTAHFVVNPDGTVEDVTIKDARWNEPAGDIVTDSLVLLVEEWTFPPGAAKSIGITQPWNFIRE